jgi:hypothetical protein
MFGAGDLAQADDGDAGGHPYASLITAPMRDPRSFQVPQGGAR